MAVPVSRETAELGEAEATEICKIKHEEEGAPLRKSSSKSPLSLLLRTKPRTPIVGPHKAGQSTAPEVPYTQAVAD